MRNNMTVLARRPDGIFIAPFEQGEIGPDLFRAACGMGLEGLVSKHRWRGYRAGTSPNLGQGEESEASGHDAGEGYVFLVV
jgi:hypothetical protein